MSKLYDNTRVVKFSCKSDGVYPHTIDEVIKKMSLSPVSGQAFFDFETYDLLLLQPVKQIVDGQDLFATQDGSVFSIGEDENALPEAIIRGE